MPVTRLHQTGEALGWWAVQFAKGGPIDKQKGRLACEVEKATFWVDFLKGQTTISHQGMWLSQVFLC